MKWVIALVMLISFFFVSGCSQNGQNGECLNEGETGIFPCCDESLTPVGCFEVINDECVPLECGHVCTNCDDGICGPGEDLCNCPFDCAIE